MKLLLESHGMFSSYKAPSKKEDRLWDFYALSMINQDGLSDEDSRLWFKEAKDTITNALVSDFKYAVYFSMACELVGHIIDSTLEGFLLLNAAMDPQMAQNDEHVYEFIESMKKNGFSEKEVDFLISCSEYHDAPHSIRYNAAKEVFNNIEFCNLALKCFDFFTWRRQYGGKAWYNIAKAFKMLLEADDTGKKMVAIDHIYDLQHNTGSVFSKVKEYFDEKSGLGWLKKALDFKAAVEEPHEFYNKISEDLKQPFAYAVKELYGKTLQSFNKSMKSESKMKKKLFKEDSEFMQVGGVYMKNSYDQLTNYADEYDKAGLRKKVWDMFIDSKGQMSYDKLIEGVTDEAKARELIDIVIGFVNSLTQISHKNSAIDPKELEKGTVHEMEHTTEPLIAAKTAIDHLHETPSYYSKLEQAGL